eukprot:scaffold1739_cov109-Cylindrotheca_fusiformis.AAC.8
MAFNNRLLSLLEAVFFLRCLGLLLTCCAFDTKQPVGRRDMLKGASIAAGGMLLGPNSACADPYNALIPIGSGALRQQPYVEKADDWVMPPLQTKLGDSRISSTSLSPIQQAPFASQDVYYPSFLFGAWKVEATLQQKQFPFGKDFVPSKSLVQGSPRNRNEKVGNTVNVELHYFSMIADDAKIPNFDLNLTDPQPRIIADRRFNSISTSHAYEQLTPIEEVDWDYRVDPTRLTFRFGAAPVSEDMRPLGQRRGEAYLTARQTELSKNGAFCAAERSRSVSVGPGTVTAADQESITEFQLQPDGSVKGISRIAVYLTPNPNSREGVLWQQVGGKAVAFYDYDWRMTRKGGRELDQEESVNPRECVVSPRKTLQCIAS